MRIRVVPIKDSMRQIRKQIRQQSKLEKLGADYIDSTKILSRGYDSLTNIQNSIKRQTQHIFNNNNYLQ